MIDEHFDGDAEPPDNTNHITHLPAAAAGQPSILSKEFNKKGWHSASIEIGMHKFSYPSDFHIPPPSDINDFEEIYNKHLKSSNIFHYHSRPILFKAHYPSPTGLDLTLLRAAGHKLFYNFRGSELRLASVFKKASPYNYVSENPDGIFTKYCEPEQRVYRDYVKGICNGVFVTDPELGTYLTEAIICPRALDLNKWRNIGIKFTRKLKILHAPSRRVVKGTREIEHAINSLIKEGYSIEFRLIEGMSNDEARKSYEWADIIIDQLRIGWYGVLAVEGMALGKAVISYIRDDLKHYLPFPSPLCYANPENIYDVLKALLENPENIISLGKRGRSYVEETHDVTNIVRGLKYAYHLINNDISPTSAAKFQEYQINKSQKLYYKKGIKKLSLTNKKTFSTKISGTSYLLKRFFYEIKRNGLKSAAKKTINFFKKIL